MKPLILAVCFSLVGSLSALAFDAAAEKLEKFNTSFQEQVQKGFSLKTVTGECKVSGGKAKDSLPGVWTFTVDMPGYIEGGLHFGAGNGKESMLENINQWVSSRGNEIYRYLAIINPALPPKYIHEVIVVVDPKTLEVARITVHKLRSKNSPPTLEAKLTDIIQNEQLFTCWK